MPAAVWLFLAFLVVPVLELALLLQVGDLVGVIPTIVLVILVSVVGARLVRREGLRAWSRFRSALASGRPPTDEVVDGALILFAGALLLTPGFLSDVLGLLLLLPPSRAVVNRAVRARVGARLLGGGGGGGPRRRRPRASHDIEVVEVRRSGGQGGTRT